MINYYPFELHTHTRHSDGAMTPRQLVELAKERGLKGIALTDHNTTSAINETKRIGDELGLTIIEGIEWTTFWGHLTVLGGKTDIDWRDIKKSNINQIIKRVSLMGDLVNIAHPKRMGLPICTGCHWDYDISDYQYISGYEVWSNAKPALNPSNDLALQSYDNLCDKGVRLACLYGDDWHDPKGNRKQYAITYLGIKGDINMDSAMDAIRDRRTYISTGLEMRLDIRDIKGNKIELGQAVNATTLSIDCDIALKKEYCIKHSIIPIGLRLKGSALERGLDYEMTSSTLKISQIIVNKGYVRLEVYGHIGKNNNKTLLLTSPIYVEG